LRKKVLIITYYWPPSGGAGVQRWLKLAKYLPGYNICPYVITVRPDHATYPVLDPSLEDEILPDIPVYRTKSREIYALYKFLIKKKDVPYGGFVNQTTAGLKEKLSIWIRGNFFIPDPRKGWNKFARKKALEIIKKETISVIITTSPPHSTQLIGLYLKKKTHLPWIADFRDPWTDIYYYKDLMLNKLALNRNLHLEHKVLESADKLIVVSNHMKKLLSNKSAHLNPDKFNIIPNGYDLSDFIMKDQKKEKQFIISYTGTLTEQYNIEGFLTAIKSVMDHDKIQLRIRFIGSFSPSVIQMIKRKKLSGIFEIHDHVNHNQSIDFLLRSTVLFLAIPDSENNEGIVTGKLFEYLACRKVILMVGPKQSDAARIIKECNCGKSFEYQEIDAMKQFLLDIYHKWSSDEEIFFGNQNYLEYSRKKLAEHLSRIVHIISV
jgi:glycosyltransferase involved in cell wall biosynthesis